jgi:hypothetical protein
MCRVLQAGTRVSWLTPKALRRKRRRERAWQRYCNALWPVARDSRPPSQEELEHILRAHRWYLAWDVAYWQHPRG